MKIKLITLTTLSALSLAGALLAQDQDRDDQQRPGGRHGPRHEMLERITERLNLTPDQKTRVQPVLDQARPKIAAIHQEAMQKTKAVMDEAIAQIRPMLTPEQQKQLDDMRNDRRERRQGKQGGEGESF